MSEYYYRLRIFCCTNQHPIGHHRVSCAELGSVDLQDYMKARAREIGLSNIRINAAGSLDRCELGPTVVGYPDGIWCHLDTHQDVDEILEQHLKGGTTVQRLLLKADA